MRVCGGDSRPIFRQISDSLRQQIRGGALRAGDAIPSERAYAEQLQVSRMTVRAAIDALVREGLLVRRPGSATVVAPDPILKNAEGFLSFTEDMRMRGMRASSHLLSADTEIADAAVLGQLRLRAGARVIIIERLRLADGEPMAIERVHLPQHRFPDLLSHDIEKHSLYELMSQAYGVQPHTCDETIEAIVLSPEDAAALRVPADSPALLARRITRDVDGNVIEVVKTIYRGDRYRMVFARRRS
jgi:GntR family transcriptional regulator